MTRSTGYTTAVLAAELDQIRVLVHRLAGAEDLDALIRLAAAAHDVCLGEGAPRHRGVPPVAAVIIRRLIEEHGFTWIGVEGGRPTAGASTAGSGGKETRTLTPCQHALRAPVRLLLQPVRRPGCV